MKLTDTIEKLSVAVPGDEQIGKHFSAALQCAKNLEAELQKVSEYSQQVVAKDLPMFDEAA